MGVVAALAREVAEARAAAVYRRASVPGRVAPSWAKAARMAAGCAAGARGGVLRHEAPPGEEATALLLGHIAANLGSRPPGSGRGAVGVRGRREKRVRERAGVLHGAAKAQERPAHLVTVVGPRVAAGEVPLDPTN